MPFVMSPKAVAEEEIMEAKSLCDRHAEELAQIVDLLHKNETLDRANDKMRTNARQHLLSALRSYNMNDYKEMNNDVHAALQKIHEQEQKDLEDDQPRYKAFIQLSILQEKFLNSSIRMRDLLEKLNPDLVKKRLGNNK